jgi:hypothetical protein
MHCSSSRGHNLDAEKIMPENPTPDEALAAWLTAHLHVIEEKIRGQAKALADAEGRDKIEPRDISAASMRYAPGDPFPDKQPADSLSFTQRILLSISGVTLMSGLLAIVFGLIGAWQTRENNPQMAAGAFDIAKIFAGAIVGSTGAAIASTVKGK